MRNRRILSENFNLLNPKSIQDFEVGRLDFPHRDEIMNFANPNLVDDDKYHHKNIFIPEMPSQDFN